MAVVSVMDRHGRIIIPARVRKQMGWAAGQRLTLVGGSHELKVLSPKQAMDRIQEEMRKHPRLGGSVVDELIRGRRAEALREETEYKDWAAKRGRLKGSSRG